MQRKVIWLVLISFCIVQAQYTYHSLIDSIDYVTYKKVTWAGKKDLSFSYDIKIKDNRVFLNVKVKDQKVFFKDNNSIVSDHVEIWLFDPEILNDIQEDIDKSKKVLASRVGKFPHPATATTEKEKVLFQDDWDVNEKMIKISKKHIDQLVKTEYANQYLFNKKVIISSPEVPLNDNIQYNYTRTISGYHFDCIIPVYNSMTIKNENLNKLGYLISVVDIDDINAVKQEKMISSSKIAKYNQPNTYNITPCSVKFNLPDSISYLKDLDKEGVFSLTKKGYKYLVKKNIVLAGNYRSDGLNLLGGYVIPKIKTFYKEKNTTASFFKHKLILKTNGIANVIDLKRKVYCGKTISYHMFDFQKKENFYYTLFSVFGYSNWPQGMGYCGAGHETELAYISLDSNLTELNIETKSYASCGNRTSMMKLDTTENAVVIDYKEDKNNDIISIIYSKYFPEDGLRTRKLKNNK